MSELAGLLMLGAVAALALATGLPLFAAMIGVSWLAALLGWLAGTIPYGLLTALPLRLVGLLENDLLQALPLYVLMGVLLNAMPLAGWIHAALARLARRTPAAPLLAALGVGALLAPMSGSVGASVAMLARIEPGEAVAPARRLGIVCASSVLGVAIPPSLVLILLGDAMMRAHTEALNSTGRYARVINTQDIFHGALVPAALLFALFALVAWWQGRRDPLAPPPGLPPRQWIAAALTVVFVGGLLGGVAAGRLYAVEAAATGALFLTLAGAALGWLPRAAWRGVLDQAIVLTGGLFGLFVAATTFTLVFRGFGTDRLLAGWVAAAPGGAAGATVLVLALIAGSALVLDAFEIVLVVVPLLLPSLLARGGDAAWTAVLVLLVLQASFLLPPFGYATMLARARIAPGLPSRRAAAAVAPFLGASLLVLALTAGFPRLVRPAGGGEPAMEHRLSDEEATKALMAIPPPPEPDE